MAKLFIRDKIISSNIELIMFDKDGTIIDIHHYWGSMIKKRAAIIVDKWFSNFSQCQKIRDELVDGMGIDLKTGRMKPEGPVGIKPRTYIVKVVTEVINKYDMSKKEGEVENIFKEVDHLTAKNLAPYLKLLPSVLNFIKQCSKHNIKMAIVTTDITSRAKVALDTLNISRYFQYIIGADQVENTKPYPDLAHKILAQSKVDISKAAVFGDHVVDIKMGINSGVKHNIGVLTGLGELDDFTGLDCECIKSFEELKIEA